VDNWYEELGIKNPFYGDDWVCILKGDCRDILPELPDNSADFVLTDPPYGIGFHSGHREVTYFDPVLNDDKFPRQLLNDMLFDCYSKLKQETAICVFTQYQVYHKLLPLVSDIFSFKNLLVWVKNVGTGSGDIEGNFDNKYELIVFATKGDFEIHGTRPTNVITASRVDVNSMVHPTQKPAELISKLILPTTEVNDTILDPFLGSGTTAYCAKKLNRKCIGIEIEEKYCEIAANRCRQTVMDFSKLQG